MEHYLNNTELGDLEKMSKGFAMQNAKIADYFEKDGKNKAIPTVIPKHIKNNPDFRFGKPAYPPNNQGIS